MAKGKFQSRREKSVNYIKNKKVRDWLRNKIAEEKAGVDTSIGREGYVYIFKIGDGLYKVGMTTNVQKRMQALKASCPHLMCIWTAKVRDKFSAESKLHKIFKPKKVQREIYALNMPGDMKQADQAIIRYR